MVRESVFDWYRHLINHSRSDNVYDLIHDMVPPSFSPATKPDFVVVEKDSWDLEATFMVAEFHINHTLDPQDYGLDPRLVFIRSEYMEPFLEEARVMTVLDTILGNSVIKLEAIIKKDRPFSNNEESVYEIYGVYNKNCGNLLCNAYKILSQCGDSKKALRLAKLAEGLLKDMSPESMSVYDSNYRYRHRISYTIPAMVYAWNGLIQEARAADSHYLHRLELWKVIEDIIENYLNLLIAGEHFEYLEEIFTDLDFRKQFFYHYEAYMSRTEEAEYELINPHHAKLVLDRVDKWYKEYYTRPAEMTNGNEN